jgi:CO/xanthine dehydrogenase Mo-binding subunit
VAMGVAATLHQEITIEKGRVVQGNFNDYPLLTAKELPEITVDVLIEPITAGSSNALMISSIRSSQK